MNSLQFSQRLRDIVHAAFLTLSIIEVYGHEEVLLCHIYDLQTTWSDLYFQSKQEVKIQHILIQKL